MTPCRWQRSGGAHCPYLEGGPRLLCPCSGTLYRAEWYTDTSVSYKFAVSIFRVVQKERTTLNMEIATSNTYKPI